MPLKQVFEDFKRSKERLRAIHEKTIECFEEIERKLSTNANDAPIAAELSQTTSGSPTRSTAESSLEDIPLSLADVQVTVNLAEELYTPKEREEVCSLFCQDPALIFVGQTNCGKSSIINQLLGNQKLKLPTSDEPSTARIVRVTYGEKPRLKIQAKDGQILKVCDLTAGKKKSLRKAIELPRKQRASAEFVQSTAIVELNNGFLKAGIDIIDSPGWNENEALDNLVKEQLKNSLPLIVYVIDGHNLLTTQDRDVLSDLVTQRQGLEIFYVLNKLEPEDRECSDDEETITAREVRSIQETKKKRVYKRLLANGFLSKASGKSMNEHEHFHGLSAWKIRAYNEQKNRNGPESDALLGEYMEAFIRFQNCLQAFAEGCLRARVEKACQVLINVLSRCLDFFIQKANDFRERKQQISRLMEKVFLEESNLNEKTAADLEARTAEIEGALSETFNEVRDDILREARTFEYNSEEGNIPQNKRITSSHVIERCRQQLAKMVASKLQDEIQCKLSMLFQSRDVVLLRMTESIQQIEEELTTGGFVPAAVSILTKSLVSNYNCPMKLPSFHKEGRVVHFFKNLFKWCFSSLLSIIKEPPKTAMEIFQRGYRELKLEVAIGSSDWKEGFASQILDAIDPSRLAAEILESLKRYLQECHNDFTEDMENIQNLLNRGGTVKDEQRKKIMEFAPSLAKQEMFAYSVMDRFRHGLPERGAAIGRGAQGVVHVCENILTNEGNSCVVKTVNVPVTEMLDNLTVELHNARVLRHPNILPPVCAIISEDFHEGIHTVFVVSERMKCDLAQALPTISSLRSRLMIAVDVAKALQYLHQANLMHRDVKLQNVLLDDRNSAKLTDFGLSKPEGLAKSSLVGTAPYMAPEMLTNYNKSVDVYAFGMMLWRVCEGKGNDPKNTHQDSWPLAILMKNAMTPLTPERLDEFPLGCWELMQECWQLDSDRRPSFDDILQHLERVLQDENIL